jgi:hypothetical protein
MFFNLKAKSNAVFITALFGKSCTCSGNIMTHTIQTCTHPHARQPAYTPSAHLLV